MESVIISGSTGFIGRHLLRCFTERGVRVFALVRPGGSRPTETGPDVVTIEFDPARWEDAAELLPRGADAFFCLSWGGVAPEDRNRADRQMPNLALTMNALRLAAAVEAKRFILPGSTAEYAYSGEPINGRTCPSPQNLYGSAKVAARFLCGSLAEELGIPFIYAVITGVYSADRRDNNVIYYAITKLLRGERPSLSKLEQRWDYVHIDDVTRALYRIAEKGKPGAFYTIGHGDNWPLANYILQIRDLIDPKAELGIGDIPYKNGRIPSSCVDLHDLQADTGFVPQVPFAEGIRSVIAQVKKEIESESTV